MPIFFKKNFLAPTNWKTEKLKFSNKWNKVQNFIERFPNYEYKNLFIATNNIR